MKYLYNILRQIHICDFAKLGKKNNNHRKSSRGILYRGKTLLKILSLILNYFALFATIANNGIFKVMILLHRSTLENTEGAIQNGQSRETGNIEKQNKTQYKSQY